MSPEYVGGDVGGAAAGAAAAEYAVGEVVGAVVAAPAWYLLRWYVCEPDAIGTAQAA